MLEVGDKVDSPLGKGVVVGFEHISSSCKSVQISREQLTHRDRVIVALDDPERWSLKSRKHPHPYIHCCELTLL